MDETQDHTGRNSIPYHVRNGIRDMEFVASHNIECTYTNSRVSLASGEVNAPKRLNLLNATFAEHIWPTKPNVIFANDFDQDDTISDEVAKNIEEGVADINSGRTYTSEQVKKMLGLQ